MPYKKKPRKPKPMSRRQLTEIENKLDHNMHTMITLYNHRFPMYKGNPSHCQLVADYLRELPCNTRFFNINICKATGLTEAQLYEVKKNRFLKRAFAVMQINPECKCQGWRKTF